MSKTALITGGSGGLGAAICRKLARQGYRVCFTFRSNEAIAQSVLDSLEGSHHHMVNLDISNTSDIQALASSFPFTSLDVLVNCAGMTKFVAHSDLNGLDDHLFDKIMQVNVRAPFVMVRTFQPQLEAAKGCVINITSIAAQTARGSNIAYCASKSAVENMTRSLARALAPNIRVLAVAPGLVDTDFVKGLDSQWRDQQEQQTPLKRLAHDTEIADAVYSTIEHLSFSTGTTIAVDGGRPLGCD